ncbi:MAG TPA: class I SAM-dependent methyltransferase [Pyrinomonadaceae bacterium]|nr:class I SAM-dependent methyltransferase [Pyrinomonadaceae bacterium]
MPYEAINEAVLARVPKTTRRLLDVGCGTGELGHEVKKAFACEVIGVTNCEQEAATAAANLDQVILDDLNDFDPSTLGVFDCIVCSHVLEHLTQPEKVIQRLRRVLTSDGTLIVALPNVLHWRQRLEFARGRFRYTDGGLMDQTHYRFFDWQSAQRLLNDSGCTIIEREAEGTFPLSRFLSRAGRRVDRAAVASMPGLFGFQFLFVCRANGNGLHHD